MGNREHGRINSTTYRLELLPGILLYMRILCRTGHREKRFHEREREQMLNDETIKMVVYVIQCPICTSFDVAQPYLEEEDKLSVALSSCR